LTTYKTSEVAKIINVHPNTIRLYEKLELIPKAEHLPNGYRIFTEFHIKQCKLVRIAFQIELLQRGLRKKIIKMLKMSAKGSFDDAIILAREYLNQIKQEQIYAEEAIIIVKKILSEKKQKNIYNLKRKEVSQLLNISIDTLLNWEMNGLITIKRKSNGYRIYNDEDIQRLKIIRTLRYANYMLYQLSQNPSIDIKVSLNTSHKTDNITSVYDQLIISLSQAEKNICQILNMLYEMKNSFS